MKKFLFMIKKTNSYHLIIPKETKNEKYKNLSNGRIGYSGHFDHIVRYFVIMAFNTIRY